MNTISNADLIAGYAPVSRQFMDGFGEEGDFVRVHLLNPALFALLGEVRGKRILDAGCGQGYLSRLLAKRGAIVTGLEPAEPHFEYVTQLERQQPLGIRYIQADLSEWSPTAGEFDVVVSNMVLMDIADLAPAVRNCVTALKPCGSFVFSLLHPCFEEAGSAWRGKGYVQTSDYFAERAVKQTYGYFIHRPLSVYLNMILESGCVLKKILEPQLDAQVAQAAQAERYAAVPGYLVVHAQKA